MPGLDGLAEKRILEALARGDLSGLPGEGHPLDLDDDSMVPEPLRMAWRVLRNAGYAPEAVTLRRDVAALAATLDSGGAGTRRARDLRRLELLRTRLAESRGGAGLAADSAYDRRLAERLGGRRARSA